MTDYSLLIYVDELHVHGMYGCEDVGGTLDDALPRLRHRDRRARGQEHRLVPTAQGQEGEVVALDQHNLSNSSTFAHSHLIYHVTFLFLE